MSSASKRDLTFSFPIDSSLTSFSCLAALAKISRNVLNGGGESGHPSLHLHISGTVSRFSPFHRMLHASLLYMILMVLRFVPSILTLLTLFIMNGCCFFFLSNAFSFHIMTWFFIHQFASMMHHIY